MANILEMVKKVNQVNYVLNHPVAKESLETKIHYLNGLALMMNVDDDIHETEKNFLSSMIKTFELDGSILDQLVTFAEAPNEEAIDELFKEISGDKIVRYNFMIDAVILSEKDSTVHKNEKELLNIFFEKLDFSKKEIDQLDELMKVLRKEDQNSAIEYYKSEEKFSDHFAHLFILDGIDIQKIVKEENELERKLKSPKNKKIIDEIEKQENLIEKIYLILAEYRADNLKTALKYGGENEFQRSCVQYMEEDINKRIQNCKLKIKEFEKQLV